MDKREEILNATLELVTENGFHGAPMSKVAKKANVAAGTIYHHFANKDALIVALYHEIKFKMGRALSSNDDKSWNTKKRFFHFWMNQYRFFSENTSYFRFMEQYNNSPFLTNEIRENGKKHYKPIIDFIKDGMQKGVLREMPIQLMMTLLHSSVAAVLRLQLIGELEVTQEVLNHAMQSCWDGARIN
ncbi:MAG: TetR/AcrR family transcriptional regulator [Flammeovirgaceae bacterium]